MSLGSGLKYGALTGSTMGAMTNWLLALWAFFHELLAGNDTDGPLGVFFFFAFGGAIIGSILGALVGLILGPIFTSTRSVRYAKLIMPALLLAPVLVGHLSVGINASPGFIQTGVVILAFVGFSGGIIFERACVLNSMLDALWLNKRSRKQPTRNLS